MPVATPAPSIGKPIVCPATPQTGGIEIAAEFIKAPSGNAFGIDMVVTSRSPNAVNGLKIQFNKSSFGVGAPNPAIPVQVPPGGSAPFRLATACSPNLVAPEGTPPSLNIQCAVANDATGAVFYFSLPIGMHCLLTPAGAMETPAFVGEWKALQNASEGVAQGLSAPSVDGVSPKLAERGMHFVVRRPNPQAADQEMAYWSCKTATNVGFLVELIFKQGVPVAKIAIKTRGNPALAGLLKDEICGWIA